MKNIKVIRLEEQPCEPIVEVRGKYLDLEMFGEAEKQTHTFGCSNVLWCRLPLGEGNNVLELYDITQEDWLTIQHKLEKAVYTEDCTGCLENYTGETEY